MKTKSQPTNIKLRIIILAVFIALILLGSLLAIFLLKKAAKHSDLYAEIYRDDELLQTIDLTDVSEPYQITFSYGEDDYNIVEVRQGSIGIVEASCPDRLCQKMGFIDNSLMPVTCLPNHLVIKVISSDAADGSEELDGMSW